MALHFAAEDTTGFEAASTSLLQRFEKWQCARGVPGLLAAEVAGEAGIALEWKWSYGDGDLGWWRTEHLADFLLEWCPRKLSVPADECLSIPESLADFVTFLDAAGLLAKGSSPVAALERATEDLTEEFLEAMDDPSQFGMAKSLFASFDLDGVDLDDPAQLRALVDEFNARPLDERRQVIPDRVMAPARPALPPVALPDGDAVAASRSAAPIVSMFSTLAGFVGAKGRRLTQTGNLALADARALVDLLGTGDTLDPQIGQRIFRTRSAAELRGLRLVFTWAKKAGVVRVLHGKVVATKKGLAIAGDPGRFFDQAVDALLALGPLSGQRDGGRNWFGWTEVEGLLDHLTVDLLAGPFMAQQPLPLDDLTAVATAEVHNTFRFRTMSDDTVARWVDGDVTDIVDALALAGMVVRAGAVDDPDAMFASRRQVGGTVALTPAGVVATRRLLEASGYTVPIAGRFADATAAQLLLGTDAGDFSTLWGELQAWRARREPAVAVQELAGAVLELDDPALRNLALAAMADIDPEAAAAEVRRLAEHAEVRGFALCWLVDQGFEQAGVLYDASDPDTFVDVLANRMVMHGPDGLAGTFALVGNHEAQVALLKTLWRSSSTATEAVIAALGATHPSKVVAKAARKALFQHRSASIR